MNNKIIIISSPSGAGKTTICKFLKKKYRNIEISVSYTTRPKRKTEKHGRDYFFINKKEFINKNKNNFFIETAKIFDHFYGSPYNNINSAFRRKKHILFDIDWQGAKKLRRKYNKSQIIDFFILPPNKKELKNRLKKRRRDNISEINTRLSLAVSEIGHYNEYQYVLINDKIIKTVNSLKKIIDFRIDMDELNRQIINYKFD